MRCSCQAELGADAAFCGYCGQPAPPVARRARRRALTGTVLDARYRIDARLAAGGFATVYRATHLETGCEVALKVLHTDLATAPQLAARFRREGAALASLRDPHTVATYEIGQAFDGTLYIAMELLRGESLAARLAARGALPWRAALAIARAACASLAEAHTHGIVHRDLKPANIHLEPAAGDPDFVKVLDFGVAKLTPTSEIADGTELTRAGEAVGTIDYMAPEQLVGGSVDARADLYALGVVLYEMLTGRRPFGDAVGATGLCAAVLTRAPVPPSIAAPHRALPPVLDGVVLRCLDREPAARFPSAAELVAAIDQVLARADAPAVAPPTRAVWAHGSPPPGSTAAVMAGPGPNEATWIDQVPVDRDAAIAALAAQLVPLAPGPSPTAVPTADPAAETSTGIAAYPAEAAPSWHHARALPAYATAPVAAPPALDVDAPAAPAPRELPRLPLPGPAGAPMPPFDVSVAGTEVGPRPTARLGVARVTAWSLALLGIGLGLGAAIALVAG